VFRSAWLGNEIWALGVSKMEGSHFTSPVALKWKYSVSVRSRLPRTKEKRKSEARRVLRRGVVEAGAPPWPPLPGRAGPGWAGLRGGAVQVRSHLWNSIKYEAMRCRLVVVSDGGADGARRRRRSKAAPRTRRRNTTRTPTNPSIPAHG